jgi:hypothetical protein
MCADKRPRHDPMSSRKSRVIAWRWRRPAMPTLTRIGRIDGITSRQNFRTLELIACWRSRDKGNARRRWAGFPEAWRCGRNSCGINKRPTGRGCRLVRRWRRWRERGRWRLRFSGSSV